MSQRANLDALGGSLAAALSVCIFYPLEVARVHLQTSRASNAEDEAFSKRAYDLMARAIRGFIERGVALRVIHTVLTSFVYYRIYSLLSRRGGRKRTVLSNLISSNFAAMLTVILAMPLETSVLNAQVSSQRESDEENRKEGEGRASSATGFESVKEALGHWYQGLTPALLLCLNPMIHYSIYDWLKLEVLNKKNDARIGGGGLQGQSGTRHQRSRPAGVWVENSNPIINRNKLTYDDLDSHQLGTGEAFIVGVVAKAAATLITFPLLRAKVLMMTSTDVRDTLADKEGDKKMASKGMSHVSTFGQSLNEEEETEDEADDGAAGSDRPTRTKTRKRSKSISELIRRSDAGKLFETLKLLFRVQGVSGLYVGVLIHLVHTTLRGAVSMTLKERLVQLLRQHAGMYK
jgi:adenine nucleotide transporter 17